jgi:hypothetical protein
MKRNVLLIGLMLAAAAVLAAGCSDSTEGPSERPSPYGVLTDKEHCIQNLVVSHKLRQIDEYVKILDPSYVWFGEKWGVLGDGTDVLDYAEDVEITGILFQDAVMLDLDIDGGTWSAVDKIGDQPCTGCWETERGYHCEIQFAGDDTIYIANNHVKFIVVPFDEGGTTKYRIRFAYHIVY